MNNDKLKDFIIKNRSSFEEDFNPDRVWSKLKKQKAVRKSLLLPNVLKYAAITILLMMAGFTMGRYLVPHQNPTTDIGLRYQYHAVDNYYAKKANTLLQDAKEIHIEHTVLDDINNLDQQYKKLENEFLNAPLAKRKSVLDAMIQNARMRVEILEYVIDIKQQFKNENNVQSKIIKI